MELENSHPFLATYLRYVANTESPRIFHVWSALACVAAAMGRRCWFDNGIEQVWPNMFVVLVGQPATRKSTAIKLASKLLRDVTKVKFAPNDTGGQRQGLLKAMLATNEEEVDGVGELIEAMVEMNGHDTISSISWTDSVLSSLNAIEIDTRDPHSIFATASELNSFIGENNTQMMTFLQCMYDGDNYNYALKSSNLCLNDGLLNILAGTTAAQMQIAMPPQAVGQGFMSRCIFVNGNEATKRIPRPTLDESATREISNTFANIFNRIGGNFEESPAAAEIFDQLYIRGVHIEDTRFLHYCDRRGTHLKKLAMTLAASRGEQIIRPIDVNAADQILIYTEKEMPEALGEYGMNKLSTAKQKLYEYVKNMDGPIEIPSLFSLMNKDMSQIEFQNALKELHQARKVSLFQTPDGTQCIIGTARAAAKKAKSQLTEIENLLTGSD